MTELIQNTNSEILSGTQGDKAGNLLSRKLSKIIGSRFENDHETIESLKELSNFFPENTLLARRNLRGQIERRSLSINQEFLEAFSHVKESLDTIYGNVTSMSNMCQEMNQRLQGTKAQTHHLIEQTSKLQYESHKLSMKHNVSSTFMKNFQLTNNELVILRGGRDNTIVGEFFQVLDKVKTIHQNCQLLLQSGHQNVALEIMEQMALYQEAALERLYRWTQSQCKNVEFPEISALLTQAMASLQDRTILFKYVLDEYCTVRRSVVVRGFIDALTSGGPGGTPRPIEMHANDPSRYIGDMLAWLHQAMPGEKENLKSLLKACGNVETDIFISEALGNIMEGVCRPFRVRVEQTVTNNPGPVMLYKLTNLLRFYQQTISQVIPSSTLVSLLFEMEEFCFATFLNSFRTTVLSCVQQQGTVPANDLSPAIGVGAIMGFLKEVLAAAGVVEDQQQDLEKIMPMVLDPLLNAIHENISHLGTADMAIFRLNCLYQMYSTLALYGFMEKHLERLKGMTDSQLSILISEQASWQEAHVGLSAVVSVLSEPSEPLSIVPGMDIHNLSIFLCKLDSYLSTPEAMLIPQSRLLVSSTHRRILQKQSLEVVVSVYCQLYQAVHDPINKYPNPDTLMKVTPEEMQRLLV